MHTKRKHNCRQKGKQKENASAISIRNFYGHVLISQNGQNPKVATQQRFALTSRPCVNFIKSPKE